MHLGIHIHPHTYPCTYAYTQWWAFAALIIIANSWKQLSINQESVKHKEKKEKNKKTRLLTTENPLMVTRREVGAG